MSGYQSLRSAFQRKTEHPQQVARIRVGVGIWLLILTAILYVSGVGAGWLWPLPLVAALHFGLAYRLFRIANNASRHQVGLQR
jgi:fatty acid desaturase